jgi:hypothetical protein
MKEKIRNYINKEIIFIKAEQAEYLKSLAGWEITVFILVNLIILFDGIFYLWIDISDYIEPIITKISGINFDTGPPMSSFPFITFSFFLLIKYLILPITIFIIIKWGKNNRVKNFLKNIVQNYKIQLQVLLVTFTIDTIYLVIKGGSIGNMIISELITGGLTGSYLITFLILFIRKQAMTRS